MENKIRQSFEPVRAEESLKQNTAEYLRRATHDYGRQRYVPHRMAAAASCAVLVLAMLFGSYFLAVPVSAVSVDVNPSVELKLNRLDRVISVRGLNEDGKALAASVQVYFMSYTDALTNMMESPFMKKYLANDAAVDITVVGEDDEKGEEMLANIERCGYAGSSNVHCRCVDQEEAGAAAEAGLPVGKYQTFLELQKLDPTVTAEEVRNMTMREIRAKIAALTGDTGSSGGTCDTDNTGNSCQDGSEHCDEAEHETEHETEHEEER